MATSVSHVAIRKATGSTEVIGSWRLLNADTGAVLATGTPKVAEFETYAS
ncbi:hypothetical protein [Streptomyces sp. UG1]